MPPDPYAITEEKMRKLEQAFRIHMNQRQACAFADVKYSTYMWRKANDEVFLERMEAAKEFLPMAAKQVIAQKIIDGKDAKLAWDFLRHVERGNYHIKSTVENEGGSAYEHLERIGALMRKAIEEPDQGITALIATATSKTTIVSTNGGALP